MEQRARSKATTHPERARRRHRPISLPSLATGRWSLDDPTAEGLQASGCTGRRLHRFSVARSWSLDGPPARGALVITALATDAGCWMLDPPPARGLRPCAQPIHSRRARKLIVIDTSQTLGWLLLP